MILFYGYDKCSTCRKAKAFLLRHKVAFKEYDITRTAPSKTVLQAVLKAGDYAMGDLFNRSGELYRAMNMKEKVKTMSQSAALDLLSTRGRLVKRPVVTDGKAHTVGFDEALFQKVWVKSST